MQRTTLFLTLLRQKALWLPPATLGVVLRAGATGRNGVLGFAGFRKDAPRLAAGCFTAILLAIVAFSGDGANDLVAVTSVNNRIRLDIRYATTENNFVPKHTKSLGNMLIAGFILSLTGQ